MSATLSFFPRTFVPTLTHNPTPRARPTTAITCQWTPPRRPRNEPVPARDRVIDFGKHKGKMLGALPSGYLKWISGNLRARDTEEWAVLADQVLADPVYRERIEWEFADRIMTGDRGGMVDECATERLMDVKDRFGWDFDDRAGWSKIKFELLGTSYGGSIPRVKQGIQPEAAANEEEEEEVDVSELDARARRRERRKGKRMVEVEESKLGFLLEGRGSLGNAQKIGRGFGGDKKDESVGKRFPGWEGKLGNSLKGRGSLGNAQEMGGVEKKGETAEKRFPGREGKLGISLRGRGSLGNNPQEMGGGGDKNDESVEKRFPNLEDKMGISLKGRGSLGNAHERSGGDDGDRRRVESSGNDVINGRFPGREGLLRQVLNRRRSSS